MTELASIKEVFPNVNVKICAFHCIQAMLRALSKFQLSSDEKNHIMSLFRTMVFVPSEYAFENALQELNLRYSSVEGFPEYFESNWENCKDLWAGYGTKEVITLNNNTNNRLESKNQKSTI